MKKLLLLALLGVPAAGQNAVHAQPPAAPAAELRCDAAIDVLLPSIAGRSSRPVAGGGTNVGADAQSIISKLSGAFMGSFAVRRGRQGLTPRLLYVQLADTPAAMRDFIVGGTPLPDLAGTVGVHRTKWDAIAGLRGRGRWATPAPGICPITLTWVPVNRRALRRAWFASAGISAGARSTSPAATSTTASSPRAKSPSSGSPGRSGAWPSTVKPARGPRRPRRKAG